jgi:hypothetical protein
MDDKEIKEGFGPPTEETNDIFIRAFDAMINEFPDGFNSILFGNFLGYSAYRVASGMNMPVGAAIELMKLATLVAVGNMAADAEDDDEGDEPEPTKH